MTGANVPSVKPNSDRREPMKPSTKDQAEGNFHKATGKLKEIAGKLSMNAKLEAEGKDEKRAGKVQKKIGQIEKVPGEVVGRRIMRRPPFEPAVTVALDIQPYLCKA